jgi:hypothetical protein
MPDGKATNSASESGFLQIADIRSHLRSFELRAKRKMVQIELRAKRKMAPDKYSMIYY